MTTQIEQPVAIVIDDQVAWLKYIEQTLQTLYADYGRDDDGAVVTAIVQLEVDINHRIADLLEKQVDGSEPRDAAVEGGG